nr:hypothetical protein [Tanacetum cinerariifolium]
MLKQREKAANLAVQQEQEEQAAQISTPNLNYSMIDDEEGLQSREKFMKDIQTFLEKFSRYSFGVMSKVLSIAWERLSESNHAFIYKRYQPEEIKELMCKLLEDVRNIREELAEFINSPKNSSNAITPVLPTEEPEYFLSIGYEHLNTIPETESDKVIKSSAKNLLPIPSEYEVTFDDKSEFDVPVKDESSLIFTTFSNPLFDDNDDFTSSDDESLFDKDVPMEDFKFYSKPLFDDDEINSDKLDLHYFNVESDFVKSLSNHDTLIDSSLKFDYLEEFSSALMPTSIVDKESIMREHEEYISLMEKLFSINSVACSLENFHANTIIETLPTSPISVEDKGDIHFLEGLLVNDSISITENESSDFDHQDDPSFPRPPSKPPDVESFFDLEPNSGEVISAVMNNIDELNEDECFDPGCEINVFANAKDDDYFPLIFFI